MSTIARFLLSSKHLGIAAFIWLSIVVYWYCRDWDPHSYHPLSLLIRQLSLYPGDIMAALTRTATESGWYMAGTGAGLVAALGAGSILLRFFRMDLDRGQECTLSLALGIGFLSYYTLFLGLAGGLNRSGFAVTAATLAAFFLYGVCRCYRILKIISASCKRTPTLFAVVPVFIILAIFLFSKALKPAVAYDALTYHLAVPHYYILEGAISYIPYDSCSNFPFAAEMLYLLGMFLSGFKLAQCTSIAIYFLIAHLIYDFCRVFCDEAVPGIAAFFFLAVPGCMEIAILYYSDLHLVYYTLLFCYSFFLWEKQRTIGCLVLMGVFAGICFSIKVTALLFIPLLSVTGIAWTVLNDKDRQSGFLRCIIVFSIPACILSSPWFVKNIIATGNPFYPALFDIFGGRDMTAQQYENILSLGGHADLQEGLTVLFKRFLNSFMPQSDLSIGSHLGPLPFLFIPLMPFIKKITPAVTKMLTASAVMLLIWSITFTQTRFMYPALVLMIIPSAYAFCRIVKLSSSPGKFLTCPVTVILLFWFLSAGWYIVNLRTHTYGMDFFDETDERYLFRHMVDNPIALNYSHPIYFYINKNTDIHSRVLIIGDAQHLYLDRRHLYTYLSATTPFDIFKQAGNNHLKIYRWLQDRGITHIVYNPAEMSRLQQCGAIHFSEEDTVYIENFLQSDYVSPVTSSKYLSITVTLYALHDH